MPGHVLIVDDDRSMCDVLEVDLGQSGFQVFTTTAADPALSLLSREDVDVVVTDLNMRGINGLELCARIRASRPDVPVIVITAFGSLETAVAAIRAGAYDFVTKPFDTEQLVLIINRAVQFRGLVEEVKRLRSEVGEAQRSEEILGVSEPMMRVFDLIRRVGDTDASVLVTGETGTGKELVARALHRTSRRRNQPFVAVNCAAVPETLLESELFGHVRGAFTGARTARKGLFVQADGGTLFLDEIGTLPPAMQAKLLRALQERRVRPVGGDEEVPVDVRIIAATNADLEEAVHQGSFREDLLYRINVVTIDLPPLRMRGNDTLLIGQHFLRQFSERSGKRVLGISSGAAARLLAYPWPGNVRELQNCIERAVALTHFEQITAEDLPDKVRDYQRSRVVIFDDDPSELLPLEQIERRYILRVLETVRGNKKLAAQVLGLDRKTLYRKLERYGQREG